ncbi:MAG: PEP-CTERM sorting domain-containing protein [Verrucomicrobiota bacterium]
MTSSPFILFVALAGIAVASAKDFENLNFDEGRIPSSPESFQPVGLVLPGWTARMGGHKLTEVYVGYLFAHNGSVTVSPQYNQPPTFEGRYGIILQGGAEYPSTSPMVDASISQLGLIPWGTQSLLFRANFGSPTEVRINGEAIPFVAVENLPNTALYGVDVSRFAGQEVDLSFVNFALSVGPGGAAIDSLRFSSSITVPEPSTWALLGTGSLALLWGARRRDTLGR